MKAINLCLLLFAILCLSTGCQSVSEEKEQWLIEQAENGDLPSQYYIVRNTNRSLFRNVNKQTREHYASSLLEKGYPKYLREKARGTLDIPQRIKWLKRAAEQGDKYAMFDLYETYNLQGYKDDTKADEWLRKAAAAGHRGARDKVREIDGVKVSSLTKWKEKAADTYSDYSGTFLARIGGIMTFAFGGLFLLSFAMIFTGEWIGLLILLALVGVVILFFFLMDGFVKRGREKDLPHWIVWIYMAWGILVGIFGQSTSDVSLNIGRLWLLEGTFGFGAKAALCTSWAVWLSTFWALFLCLKNGGMKLATARRMLFLLFMCFASFCFGAFLSIVAALLSAFLVYRAGGEMANVGGLLKGGTDGSSSEQNEDEYEYQIGTHEVRDIGTIPGQLFEDRQGRRFEKDESGGFIQKK